ncbi:hypothetical protein EDE15_1104 [Edaphobacter aggregans]|uniref:Uncharacterized protein n=1 Tax=Edaphobacter aggregans TaxID=570835 RepID=A0A3R9NS46_9BACT|nr:hypothetical protein [Edaphobacter aggregans]RSL15613.1 hypothetical protein EDE15_1104 [Edaphobacter aggregans]
MSTSLQPGQHPDADQLNSFVENALPLHEHQQTLAHLAICATCREIVYLSKLSDLGEFAASQASVKRKPWFSGWQLAWPAAAALACGVIFAVHLHNIRISNNKTVITTTAADPKTSPTLPSLTPLAVPQPSPPDKLKPTPARTPNSYPAGTPSAAAFGAVTEASTGSLNGPLQAQSAPVLSLQDHNTIFLPHTVPVSTTGSMHGSAFKSADQPGSAEKKATTGSLTSPIGGPILRADQVNADAVNHPPQKTVSPVELHSNQADLPTQRAFSQRYRTAAPVSSAPSTTAIAGTSQTVNVNGAMTTVDVTPSDQPLTENRLSPTLPSHLPVLSIVSKAQQMLALDTSGTLFFSKDFGVSWQPVPAQWTGRARKLRLTPPPSQAVAKDPNSSPTAHTGVVAGTIAQSQLSVFELTIDTGAIWTSTDGRSWKQK